MYCTRYLCILFFGTLFLVLAIQSHFSYASNLIVSCVNGKIASDFPASDQRRLYVPGRFSDNREDTRAGLELMRSPESGLMRDKVAVLPDKKNGFSVRVMNSNTSATNIALDLLNLLETSRNGDPFSTALATVDRVVSVLEKIPYHRDSGLFYSWYSTGKVPEAVNADVSSVDNIHLALALWTVKETYPNSPLGLRAYNLFNRMNFSTFYDANTGLFGGNLKHDNGTWRMEDYQFANLGSEARSIYALTWALGLLRTSPDLAMPNKAIASLKAELYNWNNNGKVRPILRTWDGGAFQLLLPKLLMSEELYSSQLALTFQNYADFTVFEGERQGIPGLAYFSASQYGFDGEKVFTKVTSYRGKAGTVALVSTDHTDVQDTHEKELWDLAFTPHAAVMAATADPARYGPILAQAERLRAGKNLMYRPGVGFMDGYHVKGPYKGQVVPVQISLNQGMIEMALSQMLSADGLSSSSRALMNNPIVNARLRFFYHLLDQKLFQLSDK